MLEDFVGQGGLAGRHCSRQKETSDHVAVKRYGTCASCLARKLRVVLKSHLRYQSDQPLQRLSIGGPSSVRKMRNVSGKTRNRAAAINVIPLGRGKIPFDVA